MLSDYVNIMYPKDDKNQYPDHLCEYLYNRFMKRYDKKKIRFLDIGTGRGTHLTRFMKHVKGDFYGIDLEKSKIPGAKIKSCNLENQPLPFEDDFFDIIFSKSVIEHVKNTENFMREIYRVLKPAGVLILMAPDWQSQMKNFYDDHTHVKPFTKKSLESALRIHNFKNIEVDLFIQLPIVWRYPKLKYLCSVISFIFPEDFKWKKSCQGRNTNDRKIIRFSKEKMLLSVCSK